MISNTSAPSPATPVLIPSVTAVQDLVKKKKRRKLKKLKEQSLSQSGGGVDDSERPKKSGKSGKGGKNVGIKLEDGLNHLTKEQLGKEQVKRHLERKKRQAARSISAEISSAWREAENFHLLPVQTPIMDPGKPKHRTRMVSFHSFDS